MTVYESIKKGLEQAIAYEKGEVSEARFELLTPKEISQKYERWIDDGEKWVPFEEWEARLNETDKSNLS